MNLSNDLVSRLVKTTNDTKKENGGSESIGTTVLYGGKMYVRLDGSDRLTPISTTTELLENERVNVSIKDHQATVIGNNSNPSASIGNLNGFKSFVSTEYSTKVETFEAIDDLEVGSRNLILNSIDLSGREIDTYRYLVDGAERYLVTNLTDNTFITF